MTELQVLAPSTPTARFRCAQCGLPFSSLEAALKHAARSGHPEPERCPCGALLTAPVSHAQQRCTACRWNARKGLSPERLRSLAAHYDLAAWTLAFCGATAEGADYSSEAYALLAEADEREVSFHV